MKPSIDGDANKILQQKKFLFLQILWTQKVNQMDEGQ
jgi:hypothetical protein